MNFGQMCCGHKQKSSNFKICIDNHENERFYLEVNSQDKIREIKLKVFGNKVDPEKSQLYYQRRKLENDWTVQYCNLQEQSKLYLIYGQNIKA